MSNELIENIISLVEKRRDHVLETNALTESNDIRYQWVKGIYDDIVKMLEEINVWWFYN